MEFFIPVSSLDAINQASPSYFQVTLPRRITLTGDYEVALWEISYPSELHTFVNDKDGEIRIEFQNELFDTQSEKFSLPVKCYHNVENLVAEINDHISDYTSNIKIQMENPNSISISANTYHQIWVSDLIRDVLGFRENSTIQKQYSKYQPNILQQHNFINVCVDIVQPLFYGKRDWSILRRFQHEQDKRRYVLKTFDKPFYFPLARTDFDTITVQITNDHGNPISFDRGTILLLLHIKQKQDYNGARYL